MLNNRSLYIDWLRGLSILAVVVTHGLFNPKLLGLQYALPFDNFAIFRSNGYLGVSVFFVISGFLITQKLLQVNPVIVAKRRIQLFYLNRFARIFPPLASLYLIGFILATLFSNLIPEFSISRVNLLFVSFLHAISLTYNYFYLGTGGSESGLRIYIPLWSLSIEELFYLIWPILFIFCNKKFITAMSFITVAGGIWYRYENGLVSLYHYLGCFDMIAIGAISAILVNFNWNLKFGRTVSATCIFLLLVFYSTFDVHKYYTFAPTVIGFLTALYLIFSSNAVVANPLIKRLLSPLQIMGVLSYEIYLFHLIFLLISWRIDFHFKTNFLSTPIPLAVLVVFSYFCHKNFFEPLRSYLIRRFNSENR